MPPKTSQRIRVIDSHTGGEPTRVVVGGVPEPVGTTMVEKRESFRRDYDWLRTAAVCEPRGHDALVGALLCKPTSSDCVAGAIFFNNVGCLNGCLHGTLGVAVTLRHLGMIGAGEHRIDSPVGPVTVVVSADGSVTARNVRSYRAKKQLEVDVPGFGKVSGDVAWGGNWFFLLDAPTHIAVDFRSVEGLTHFAWAVRQALRGRGVTGDDGGEIDHIEIFGPPSDSAVADSRNFVLCPGKAYDRSPCGTGTSAKLACLYADGKLEPGQPWRQAGILDTVFIGSVEPHADGGVIPTLTGTAFINMEAELLIDPTAPFAFGIPSPIFNPNLKDS